MALSITVNGAGTFSASMEEGPVSFSASLAAVGPAGPGVAAGGAEGQVLVKASATDYDTEWIDNSARSEFVTARNNTGSTIAKGKVVYLSGATGNKPTMALAQANSEATSARTIGITKAEVANNADGDVIISGEISGLDTSAFTAGNVLYLSSSVAGGLQTTLPTQPNHGVVIGIVTRAHPTLGSIEVTIQNYQELGELSDVLINSKANNDLLAWDSTASVWKNRTFSALGLLTSSTAASTYAPIASPTFTGTVTIPAGASISGYLTTASASSTYAPLASPTFTGTVTIPAGASISGYLTTATASSTYAPIASPTFTGTVTIPAGASISGFAPLASPALTGTPTAPTAAAATNTTQIATTAFVQQEVPAASTTAVGKVELATDAEAAAGTDTTRAVTPAAVQAEVADWGFHNVEYGGWTATTSGTGASTGTLFNSISVGAPTTAVGYGTRYHGLIFNNKGRNYNAVIDFSKRAVFYFQLQRATNNTDANGIIRVVFGKTSLSGVAGDPTGRSVGVKIAGNGNFIILAHDGTTLTSYTTSTASSTNARYCKLVSDGAGNVELFIDGSSAGSTTGGPTGLAQGNSIIVEAENIAIISTTKPEAYLTGVKAILG